MKTEQAKETAKRTIEKYQNRLTVLEKLDEVLATLDIRPDQEVTGYENVIDFDGLTHEEIVKLMLAFPGKWEKEYSERTIHYKLKTANGYILRAYDGEPPPNCRLEEYEVHTPETVVPAKTEKRYKLVCKNGEPTQ